MKNTRCRPCGHHSKGTSGAPTSYGIQDADALFDALELKPGDHLADLGCGHGDYSLRAAQIIGPEGNVYAIDHWPGCAGALEERARKKGLTNIVCLTADIRKQIPIPDGSVSVCLLFTVLHAVGLGVLETQFGKELQRILGAKAKVAVLELKKEEQPFGPPLPRRLAPDQVETAFARQGFKFNSLMDLGFTYLMQLHS
nr:methyltransferase domain-containing protein [uncultured Desulfobacter sp.]